MRIAILGFGDQGRSAYEYWKDGNQITICEQNPDVEVPKNVELRTGPNHLKGLDGFDLIVRSPIVHPTDVVEANSPEILAKVTSVTNEFFRVSPTKNVIGVTGTKGKGTTSTLIAKLLEAQGKRIHLGGNIGVPPLDLLRGAGALHGDNIQDAGENRNEPYPRYGEGESEPATKQIAPSVGGVAGSASEQGDTVQGILPEDWVVLELANFQLIDLKYSPHIAVCLMVVPEHLDWHPGVDEYIDAKTGMFKHQSPTDIAIYFAENENSQAVASSSPGKKVPYYRKPGTFVRGDGMIVIGENEMEVANKSDVKLLGEHNLQNVCAALTAVFEAVGSLDKAKAVLSSFSGLEHRLELVRGFEGVNYYDDSFGTTPETAIVALKALPQPKIMILGGSEKGADYTQLADEVVKSGVKHAITIGPTGEKIAGLLKNKGFTSLTEGLTTMPQIVEAARKVAQEGDVVLLSTGSASFGLFKNYKDRGEQFKRAVLGLS